MKIALAFIFYCCLTTLLFAQQKSYNLKGYIAIEGGESFTYKLIFKDSAGVINGYSLIYANDKQDVKTTISGHIDRALKSLQFSENEIEYNHGFQSNVTLCLVQAILKYKCSNANCKLSGSITSSDVSNAACSAGSITFQDQEALAQLFNDAPATDTLPVVKKLSPKHVDPVNAKKVRVVYDTASRRAPLISGPEEITSGVEKVYEWTTDTLSIEVWDGGRVDDDKISIRLNNNMLLKHYVLSNQKKMIKVYIPKASKNQLVILAENEGNEPPNTADLLLHDGDKEYRIVAYNNIGQEAVITINRK